MTLMSRCPSPVHCVSSDDVTGKFQDAVINIEEWCRPHKMKVNDLCSGGRCSERQLYTKRQKFCFVPDFLAHRVTQLTDQQQMRADGQI